MWIVGVAMVIVLLSFVAAFFSWLLALAGLLWAPFGALICGRAARKSGLSIRRYAAVGAVLSVLYFFPWLHLALRMNNWYLLPRFIWWAYFVLYVIFWLIGVMGFGLWMLSAADTSAALDRFAGVGSTDPTLIKRIITAQLVVNAVLWIVTLIRLWRMNRHDSNYLPTSDWDPLLPHSTYILPFACAWVGSVAMFATASLGVGIWR